MVPQKCVIPLVEEPRMDNAVYYENKDIIARVIKDYLAEKKYAEKLLAAQEVCK
jgi:hypothetical protein